MVEFFLIVSVVVAFGVLIIHHVDEAVNKRPSVLAKFVGVPGCLIVLGLYLLLSTYHGIPLMIVVAVLFVYGAVLYVVLCDLLRGGLGRKLTEKRGEKWAKEIDYIYLLLGTLGVLGTLNRLDAVSDRFSRLDLIGPAVLTTAVVVRLIKTRAEIAGWNKLTFHE